MVPKNSCQVKCKSRKQRNIFLSNILTRLVQFLKKTNCIFDVVLHEFFYLVKSPWCQLEIYDYIHINTTSCWKPFDFIVILCSQFGAHIVMHTLSYITCIKRLKVKNKIIDKTLRGLKSLHTHYMLLNLTSPLGGNYVPCELVHGEILLNCMPHLMNVQLHSKPIHIHNCVNLITWATTY
jgi:hypothetical protein